MHFSEPVTALTDYALGIASLYFAIALLRSGRPKRTSVRLWSLGFFASAVAAFVGGTYHGLKLQAAASVIQSLWSVTIYFIGVSGAFMVSGVLTSSIQKHDKSRTWLLTGLAITVAGLLIQQSPVQLTANINHNDLFHTIQIAGQYFFFKGARLLEDRGRHD